MDCEPGPFLLGVRHKLNHVKAAYGPINDLLLFGQLADISFLCGWNDGVVNAHIFVVKCFGFNGRVEARERPASAEIRLHSCNNARGFSMHILREVATL